MDITTLSLTELKALAYEQLVLLNRTQNNLKIIEQEIAKRNNLDENIEQTS
jgi:hypothetical protein